MKADVAMWAAVVVSDHLVRGRDIEDSSIFHLGLTLAMFAKSAQLPLTNEWDALVGDKDRTFLSWRMESEGFMPFEVADTLMSSAQPVENALSSGSWEAFESLPDKIWRYIKSASGMSKEEWKCLPITCASLMDQSLECPSCHLTDSMGQGWTSVEIGDPYGWDGVGPRMMFHCPKCNAAVPFDVVSKNSVKYEDKLTVEAKLIKRIGIGIALFFVLGSILMLLLRH